MRVLFGQSSKTFCSDLVLHPVVAWENVLTWSQVWTIAVCVLPDQACKAGFGSVAKTHARRLDWRIQRRFRAFDRRRMTATVEVSSVQLLLYLVVVSHY